MWCLGTQFIGGLGSARLTVALDDLKGPFQPKLFYSMILDISHCPTLAGIFWIPAGSLPIIDKKLINVEGWYKFTALS